MPLKTFKCGLLHSEHCNWLKTKCENIITNLQELMSQVLYLGDVPLV